MQQDYNNFQNNQNYQGNPYYANYNYDPNNPYYQYDPNYPVYQNVQVINTAEKKPRSVKALNIISTILTILSVITAPFLFFMILLVGFGAMAPAVFQIIGVCIALALGVFVSLALSIVAKIINHRSVWALVNIIVDCAVIVFPIISAAYLINNPVPVEDHSLAKVEINSDESPYYEDMMESLESHDFDEVYTQITTKNQQVYYYRIDIYISSEATDEEIEEIEEYLKELRDIFKQANKDNAYPNGMKADVEIHYYIPDEEKGSYYLGSHTLTSYTSDSNIDIDHMIDDALKNDEPHKHTLPTGITGYYDVTIIVH